MPTIGSKLVLSSAAQSANTVLADVGLIKGALSVVDTVSDLDNINAAYLEDGQIKFVAATSTFYKVTIEAAGPGNGFVQSESWAQVSLGSAGTILSSQTSSMSVATASFISDTFISASAVRSGFGTGGGSSTDISSLNTFTGSIQTEVTTLTAATSSYLTSLPSGTISGSAQIGGLGYITSVPSGTISSSTQVEATIDDAYISASAAASGFGASGAGVGTLQQVTDNGSSTNVSMSIQKIEIFSGDSWTAARASSSIFIGEDVVWASKSNMSSSVLGNEGNTFLGGNAGRLLSSMNDNNTVIGFRAAYGDGLQTNNLGHQNTLVGSQALYKYRRGGGYNTAIGYGSLGNFLSGSRNTSIGTSAGFNLNSGSNNIYIGHISQTGNANGTEHEIVIGKGVIGNGSNTVTIGSSDNTDNYFSGNISGSDVKIDGWGSISASLATLEASAGGGGSTDISSLNTFTGSIQTEVDSLTSATSSYLTSVPSGTLSSSAQVETIIDDTYISASAALSGFGAGGGDSTDISSLNTFTGSIQTEVDSLTSATSSYLTTLPSGTISGSTQISGLGFLSSLPSGTLSSSAQVETIIDDTYISASAAASGFGAGGGVSTDISSLNTFSGSVQTEVDSLTQATASYLDKTNTVLVEQATPIATAGGIYYSGSSFFVGID